MSPAAIRELSARIERAAESGFRLPAYDHRRPHVFAEAKSDHRAELRSIAAALRAHDVTPARPVQSALAERVFGR